MPELSAALQSFWAELPDEIRRQLPDSLYDAAQGFPDSEDLLEATSFSSVLQTLRDALLGTLPSALKGFGQTLLCLLFSAVFGVLCEAWGRDKLTQTAQICSRLCMAALLCEEQIVLLRLVSATLQQLQVIVNAMLPVLAALLAAGGNTATAAAGYGSLALFLNLAENLIAEFFLPLTAAVCGLTAVVGLSDRGRLRGLLSCLRRVLTYTLSLFGVLFSAVLSAQTLLASGADSVSAKTLKFALGKAIPVIGSAVGDSVRTVASGLSYLKNTVGVMGILLTLLPLLGAVMHLVFRRAALTLGEAAAELLGCEGEQKLLGDFASINGILLALLAGAAVCFIFALILFVRMSLVISA
ncbi:MAG: hypothetical protein IJF49_02050 [Clostridia bacterium]|nr:hypothetical protein [Clostridia bacterium]